MDKREDTGNYYPGGTVVTGTPVPVPGGGSSVEVVAPSADGAGKAADAKAVYEGLERKLNKSDVVTPTEEAQKGQAADAKAVHEGLERKLNKYPFVNHNLIDEPNEVLNLTPYARTNVVMAGGDTFTVLGVLGGNSEFLRDLQMVVDCRNGSAPTITWNGVFHPRTDAETDLACVAGVRNVYWITEYAPNEFCVAGWQETTGGNADVGE